MPTACYPITPCPVGNLEFVSFCIQNGGDYPLELGFGKDPHDPDIPREFGNM